MHHKLIAVNGRFRSHTVTGIQRYAQEVVARLERKLDVIAPERGLKGSAGHLWEQVVLPRKLDGKLLWSPSSCGPIAVRNQVITIHDVFAMDHPEWYSRRFAAWYAYMMRTLVHRSRHVIADSFYSRQRLIANTGVAEGKISVVPLAAGERFSPQSREAVENTCAELTLPSRKYVLSVGSVEPRKNLARTIEAWRKAAPRLPRDLWLVIAGGWGRRSVFASLDIARPPERVIFTGYVPDEHLPALYSGATAFLYPSLAEGFGLPPLEALACGTPVVTSNTSAIPEAVGSAARFVDSLSADSIAEGLLEITLDGRLRQKLRAAGFEQAKKFSWDQTAAQIFQVLAHAS